MAMTYDEMYALLKDAIDRIQTHVVTNPEVPSLIRYNVRAAHQDLNKILAEVLAELPVGRLKEFPPALHTQTLLPSAVAARLSDIGAGLALLRQEPLAPRARETLDRRLEELGLVVGDLVELYGRELAERERIRRHATRP
jgi:hypothetical protein